ncbi:TetR/AcrR family transcriptional regulator [Aliidiomarina soli]|uniref:TetR/AcrR family transcriptional regulator n=1 Tax=Aliidiomarina soli TaxID=1928574 RepID=A0A432WJP6_9GAMM|nr:TetR/AcrR family transcriptional regulator [Aliidiomarina soli]RUO34030.1 TetR/AcrR family transcriptional regulator [Aliidiomarina soli]
MNDKPRGGRPSKRSFILVAAEQLVKKQGPAQLTFDRLSEETGISKGGLLYHFASKDELVLAMMERLLDSREKLRETIQPQFNGCDAEIKALIMAQANVRAGANADGEDELALDSAVLCAASNNRDLLSPMRGRFNDLLLKFDQSEMGGDKARIAFFAVLGERLMQQLGMVDSSPADRERFVNAIRAYVD